MSLYMDAVLEMLDDAELDEDGALDLVHKLARRYQWTTCIWTPADVLVLREGEDEDEAFIDDGERPETTEAMRWVIANSWAWRRGIPDTASERVGEMIPKIVVGTDGSFTMDGNKYTAEGERVA